MRNRIRELRYVPARVLVYNPKNWRTHPKRQRDELSKLLEEVGIAGAVLARELPDGRLMLIDGHLRTETIVGDLPVLVVDVDEKEADRLLANMDPIAAMAGTDHEKLDALIAACKFVPPKEEVDDPPPATDHGLELGQVWELGRHTLRLGDSTKLEHPAAHCVITDPPYAIYGSSSGIAADIADDKMIRPFFERIMAMSHQALPWFGHAYVFCDWRSWAAWYDCAKHQRMAVKNLIVWDKGGGGLGSSYANAYELIGFYAKLHQEKHTRSKAHTGQRQVHKPNIMRFNRTSGAERLHNAAKPVPLLQELIENSTDKGQTVLDLFCGSGSTIIACEMSDRVCETAEIDLPTAEIAIARWERYTGKRAACRTKRKARPAADQAHAGVAG